MQKLSTSVGEQDGEHMLSFFCRSYFTASLIEKKGGKTMWELYSWGFLMVAFVLAAICEAYTR